LSDGEFLNSQPENTLFQTNGWLALARSSTKTWTKAPTSGGCSHGAVFSQVPSFTKTLLTRRDSPLLSTISCSILLRLFSKPSVATRSFTGVPNWFSTTGPPFALEASACGTSVACASVTSSDWRLQPVSASAETAARASAHFTRQASGAVIILSPSGDHDS
jgi:hypothetical protein